MNSPFCEVLGRDLLTKMPAMTQSELFADLRCVETRLMGTGILPIILSWMLLDDNNGLIMRRPNIGSAAGSKPNLGTCGEAFFVGLVFTTSSSKSTTLDFIDLKKSPNVPATFSDFPSRSGCFLSFFDSTKMNKAIKKKKINTTDRNTYWFGQQFPVWSAPLDRPVLRRPGIMPIPSNIRCRSSWRQRFTDINNFFTS